MAEGKRARALSFVEILIFCGIFAILCVFFYSNYFKMNERSRFNVARTYVFETLPKALESYKLDVGEFPADEQGLEALLAPPIGVEAKWKGPYLSDGNLKDPWGNDYLYTYPSTQGDCEYDLWSRGSDGITSDDDISNWKKRQEE